MEIKDRGVYEGNSARKLPYFSENAEKKNNFKRNFFATHLRWCDAAMQLYNTGYTLRLKKLYLLEGGEKA